MAKNKKKRGKLTAANGIVWSGPLARRIALKYQPPVPVSSQIGRAQMLSHLRSGQMLSYLQSRDAKAIDDARRQKMPLLLKLFAIKADDPQKWENLAYHLACATVPGFQFQGQSGRPRRDNYDVYLQVKIYERDHGPGITAACRALTRPGQPLAGMTWENARTIHGRREKGWEKTLHAALALHDAIHGKD